MKIQVGYGRGFQEFDVNEKNLAGVLLPNPVDTCRPECGEVVGDSTKFNSGASHAAVGSGASHAAVGSGASNAAVGSGASHAVVGSGASHAAVGGAEAVTLALREPIGTRTLRSIVRSGEKVAIVTSDNTRPFPGHIVLPQAIGELESAGIPPADITVTVALGIHRPLGADEIRALVGDATYGRVRCENSKPDDFVRLGVTSRGTPVEITRAVAAADRRVTLGNIEYHYFAGYSGGAKALIPGVSTRAAIQSNHRMMVRPEAAAGRIDGNPVRADIDEVLEYCPIDFIVNVVLDEHKKIVRAFAGHPIAAHRAGCAFLDCLYSKRLPGKSDIVIASQGGSPKDVNLYQLQKALDNAKYAVRDGGVVILAGTCDEGMGEPVFEEWMTSAASPESIIERIGSDFQLGGHKAAAIAMTLQRADIYLVSEMDADFVGGIFMRPYKTVREALAAALEKLGPDASVLVMPYAGSTLPIIEP